MGYLELMASLEASKHTHSWLLCWHQQALKETDEAKIPQAAITIGGWLLQTILLQNIVLDSIRILKIIYTFQIQLHQVLGSI